MEWPEHYEQKLNTGAIIHEWRHFKNQLTHSLLLTQNQTQTRIQDELRTWARWDWSKRNKSILGKLVWEERTTTRQFQHRENDQRLRDDNSMRRNSLFRCISIECCENQKKVITQPIRAKKISKGANEKWRSLEANCLKRGKTRVTKSRLV